MVAKVPWIRSRCAAAEALFLNAPNCTRYPRVPEFAGLEAVDLAFAGLAFVGLEPVGLGRAKLGWVELVPAELATFARVTRDLAPVEIAAIERARIELPLSDVVERAAAVAGVLDGAATRGSFSAATGRCGGRAGELASLALTDMLLVARAIRCGVGAAFGRARCARAAQVLA